MRRELFPRKEEVQTENQREAMPCFLWGTPSEDRGGDVFYCMAGEALRWSGHSFPAFQNMPHCLSTELSQTGRDPENYHDAQR